MKSPDQLRLRLSRQWFDGATRAQRLLDPAAWPLRLPIGKPTPQAMRDDLPAVRAHLDAWRAERVGTVEYTAVRYRSTAKAVELPQYWRLDDPDQWIAATGDDTVRREYQVLHQVLRGTDARFHALLIRQRQMLLVRGAEEITHAAAVALALTPGYADSRPLRALSVAGCDSKFFERHRALLMRLLAVRFGEEALDAGLESFLGAADDTDHWLLVAPLDAGLLPFRQLRLRASELRALPSASPMAERLPGQFVLIVENERSLYQLPALPDTIAILGAGLNLGWLDAAWLAGRHIAYWGDLDTWGLTMLARAREQQPALSALLMDAATFSAHAAHAVREPMPTEPLPPTGLTPDERALYRTLLSSARGRLEQEFLPEATVHEAVRAWRGSCTD